jgi:hypothetical protein
MRVRILMQPNADGAGKHRYRLQYRRGWWRFVTQRVGYYLDMFDVPIEFKTYPAVLDYITAQYGKSATIIKTWQAL